MRKIHIYLFVLVCLLAATFFSSCSPKPADPMRQEVVPIGEYIFSREEVAIILLTNGISTTLTLTDDRYVAPTLEWLEKQYSDKLTKFLFDYNLHRWTQESSDCDDISRAAAVQASILFHNSKSRPKSVGLLFGEYHYIKSALNGHAINLAIVADKGVYKLVFYEPQVKYIISPTDQQISSSLWVRF